MLVVFFLNDIEIIDLKKYILIEESAILTKNILLFG